MAEVIRTLIQDNLLIVLGIMVLGVVYLLWDREMTFLCPADESTMKRLDNESFRCGKCGFVKRV